VGDLMVAVPTARPLGRHGHGAHGDTSRQTRAPC
jgi:hypothetical protein